MNQINISDKVFSKEIEFAQIQSAIQRMGRELSEDYAGKEPLFLCVLNGSFMFSGDLLKEFDGSCEVSFIKLSSYHGTTSTEDVKTLIGLTEDIYDRDVIIVEDIIDTGYTVKKLLEDLHALYPRSVRVVTLLLKPAALRTKICPDYVGLKIPNDFIVGYGLDYNGFGRNYKDIYKIVEE